MSNKQLGMEKIRQVLRCYSQGYGTKSISSMLTVSRNTVKKYLQVFQRSGLDYEGVLSLSDQELSELFHEKTRVKTESERMEELKSLPVRLYIVSTSLPIRMVTDAPASIF